jgi:hypothetical protein
LVEKYKLFKGEVGPIERRNTILLKRKTFKEPRGSELSSKLPEIQSEGGTEEPAVTSRRLNLFRGNTDLSNKEFFSRGPINRDERADSEILPTDQTSMKKTVKDSSKPRNTLSIRKANRGRPVRKPSDKNSQNSQNSDNSSEYFDQMMDMVNSRNPA